MNHSLEYKNLYSNGYRCIYYNKINSNHTVYLKNFKNEKSETLEFTNETDFNKFKDFIKSQKI